MDKTPSAQSAIEKLLQGHFCKKRHSSKSCIANDLKECNKNRVGTLFLTKNFPTFHFCAKIVRVLL